MKFNGGIERFYLSGARAKVMRLMFKSGFAATGRQVARLCGISHTMAIRVLKELEGLKAVKNRPAGKSVLWEGDRGSYAFRTMEKLNSRQALDPREHLEKMILEALPKQGYKKAYLYGSVAEGTEEENSDIDVYISASSEEWKKRLEGIAAELSIKCLEIYGNSLHAYILTEGEEKEPPNRRLMQNIYRGVLLNDKKGGYKGG